MSCVATITAAPCVGELARAGGEGVLVQAVHSSRRLVEQHHGGGVARQHDLQRQALALAAGQVARVRLLAAGQPGRSHAGHARVLDGVAVHEVVARVLEQERDLAGPLDAPARGLGEPLGEPQERALAGAVAAHERDPLAGVEAQRQMPRRIVGPSSTSNQTSLRASAGSGPPLR